MKPTKEERLAHDTMKCREVKPPTLRRELQDDEIQVNGKRYLKPDGDFGSDSGLRLTDCCGAMSTYLDTDLCCKNCWHLVEVGEGDGCDYLHLGHVDDFDARA